MPNLHQQKTYKFDGFCLDAAHLLLYQDGREITLAPKVVATLLALVERSGEILSKDELMEIVWADSIVEEGNLTQNLYLLRKVLGKTAAGKPFIETRHRRGYRFNGDVVCVESKAVGILPDPANQSFALFDPHDPGIARRGNVLSLADWRPNENPESEPDEEEPAPFAADWKNNVLKTRVGARVIGGVLIIAAIASIGFGYWYFSHPRATAAQIESIAVLPFENADGDPDLDYLSDGLSEGLIDRLSELTQLKVVARSSSFKFRGEGIDLQDAAKQLGARAIITGRVARRGDDLSIRVEMIDVHENRQLFSQQYNRRMIHPPTIQREIAQTVLEKLRLKFSGAQEQELAKLNTVNPQAYELFLKGRLARRGNQEGLKKSIQYLEQAIEVDPNYALAYAELSFTYGLIAGTGVLHPKDVEFKIEAAARKSLELDANLADAHLAMGVIEVTKWDWANAENDFRRALDLNPNLARAHMWYSNFLSLLGRHEEAIAEARRGKELDPLSPRIHVNYGWAFLHARQYEQAIEIFKKTLELDPRFGPTHSSLGFAYMRKAMFAEAIAEFQEEMRMNGSSPTRQIYLGAAYAKAGMHDKAGAILKHLEKSDKYVAPGELAVLYTSLGEREKVFTTLEKAYAAHDLQLQHLKVEQGFDPIRDDPRFHDLLRRVGLPQ